MDQAATTDPTDTAVGDTNVVGAVKFGLAVGFNIKSSSQLTLDGNEQSTPVTPSAAETFTENASSNEPNFGQSHILQLSSFINTTPSARDVAKNASALLGLSNLFKNTALDLASVGHVIAKIIATVEISFLLDFSAGRLPQAEIQVFRTATFLCMGPNPERITSSAIPVFYIPSSLPSSAQHPETVIKKYWALIGAPSHAPNTAKIRRIPSVSPNSDAMDVATLIAFLSEDIAVGRRPCVVYARAASSLAQSVTGEWDDLTKIREICSRFGCWMHVECDNVAVLATPKDANSAQKIESLRTADSIAFTPSAAFQLVNQYDLPAVTLFNTVDPRLMDPLHLESFDSAASEKSSHFSLQSVQKRRTGGSAGGALIAAALRPSVGGMMERTSAEHSRESFSMSRSGSISSVNGNGNNNTGNNTGSNTPSTAPTPKLFKRISSCALFQNLLNQSGVEPVSLKFTLPWWVWSTGKYSERLIEAFEVGRDLTEKLYDDLENIPDLNVHLTANASNYLTLLTQFNPTIPSSETLLKHSEPSPAHLSHIPPPSGQQFISKHHHTLTTNSPWTPGYETPLKLMEETRREAWGNRMNADLGTRVLFNRIPTDLKNAFNLELVKFSDPTNESNRTFLTNKLVEFLAKLSRAINETLQHQKTLQSIVASLDGPPIELRYIPPMSLVAGDRHNKDHSDEIGLGGLHFTPTYLDAESNDLAVVTDLDALNVCLADEVARRRGGDGVVGKGVIVPGVDVDGVTGIGKVKCCLRIGLDENGYNPEKIRTIVNDVLATGRILERSDEFLATLSEVIKRGIHEAELDLKKENSGSGGGSNNNDEILHSLPVIGTVLGLIGVISPTNLDHHHNHHGENPESSVLLKDTTVRSNSSARFSEDTEGRVSQSFVGSPRRKMARSFTISSGFSTVPVDIDVEKSAAVAAAAAARKQALAEEAQRLKDQDIEDESGEEYIDDGEYDSNIYLEKGHEADNANVKQVDEDKEKEDLQMNTLEDVQEDSEA
ncbi:Pyridoxal-dependent decarboxylase domain-containing protein 1 [Physocladia obscura]|uniref:Pyridoxal-dependent decarboxylase domain-containing protein 1 n=1 Tax=Physocladia obscura TaxID=109957 RepID=A0AAD5TBB2_9FUNG|nr:Pyridoxal-dependent decarboxylase domain-containing protein 1 [Physocladia obscura]